MSDLCLYDLSAAWWRNWHATADKPLNEAFDRTIADAHRHRGLHQRFAVCCDSPPYWRKALLPTYKAQRDKPEPSAIEQFTRVKERLAADGLVMWAVPTQEADDVIATATALAVARKMTVTIVSSDKDLLSLVSDDDGVEVYSPSANKTFRRVDVIEKLGIDPAMVRDFLALQGDASDNVPGVRGVGAKTAAKLLMLYGDLAGVLGAADQTTPKLCEALITDAEQARTARQLVELRADVPLNFEELFEERKAKPLTKKDYEDEGFERGDAAEDDDDIPISPPPKPPSQPKSDPVSERPSAPPPPPPPVATPAPVSEVVRTQQTAIVVPAQQVEWSLQLEPRTIDGAFKLARGLHESRLYASKFASPEAIMTVMIRGREMGIPALVALDVFHFFEGKLALHAHLIVARAQALPDCEFFQLVSSSGTHAEYKTKHRKNPDPTTLRYTLEQAKQAGLCPDQPRMRRDGGEKDRRGNWEKRPEEMLRKTCATQLVRIVYPDAALGIYAIEELEGEAAA